MRSRVDGMWWGTAIEAPDPTALAKFYSDLLEWPIVHVETGTAILAAPQGQFIVFSWRRDTSRQCGRRPRGRNAR